MNELNLTTPSLLFSAISLILLAYTNRFLSYASVIRTLNEKYQENPDKDPTTLSQIRNFVLRLKLIRAMQTLGAGSLLFCLSSMFFYFIEQKLAAEIIFGAGMLMLAASLILCIWEVQISTEAISLHLQNIRKRQREQDIFIGNSLRRNAIRREGETLGEHNTRKNQEKQRKEKLEREERRNRERKEQEVLADLEKTQTRGNKEKREKPELAPAQKNIKTEQTQLLVGEEVKIQPEATQLPKEAQGRDTTNTRSTRSERRSRAETPVSPSAIEEDSVMPPQQEASISITLGQEISAQETQGKKERRVFANRKPKTEEQTPPPSPEARRSKYQERQLERRNYTAGNPTT